MQGFACASEGGDNSVFVHFANPIVARDVEVPLPAHCHRGGVIELCLGGEPAIARETSLSGARHGRDGAMSIYLANGVATGSYAILPRVRDVHVSFCGESNIGGPTQTGLRCGAAVSEFRTTVARHRRKLWLWLRSLLSSTHCAAASEHNPADKERRNRHGGQHYGASHERTHLP